MIANTATQPRNSSSIYFGKISSRGDFVKSASGTKLINLIDHWAAQGMELLIANPGWKSHYDRCEPIDLLFIGTHKKHAICGALIPSADASSRRFPFIAATVFEIDEPLAFLPLSPILLERHTNRQRTLSHDASKAHDAADTLAALADAFPPAEAEGTKCRGTYTSFLKNTTIAGLGNTLATNGGHAAVRQMILAIGYLLQPVLTNYAIAPQKGLALPLPLNTAHAAPIRALWLDLICTFLTRADFELSIFSCVHAGKPRLLVTFNGTTPTVFHALFEEAAGQDLFIDIEQSAWVEEYAAHDAATFKLASYLAHAELTLQQLVDTFREAFIG